MSKRSVARRKQLARATAERPAESESEPTPAQTSTPVAEQIAPVTEAELRDPNVEPITDVEQLSQGAVALDAPEKSSDSASQRYRVLARVQQVCGLEDFVHLDDEGGGPDEALRCRARFRNGLVTLARVAPNQPWGVERAEHSLAGGHRTVVFDRNVLRIALSFHLASFNPMLSDPSRSQWTFGRPGKSEPGSAVILRSKLGKYSLTLRPGTSNAVILAEGEHSVCPLLLCERVFELVNVGEIRSVERGLLRCEEADLVLIRAPGTQRGMWLPHALRFSGSPPIPVQAFELAAELGFGAFIKYEQGKPVIFERGAIELSEDPLAVRRVSTRAGLVLVS